MKESWFAAGAHWDKKSKRQEKVTPELVLWYESSKTHPKCLQYFAPFFPKELLWMLLVHLPLTFAVTLVAVSLILKRGGESMPPCSSHSHHL